MLDNINFTNLYLLEFFVDKARFENVESILGEYFGKKLKLCLSFQFLQYPPMEVCEEVFMVKNDCTVNLKKGKSCLFASKNLNNRNSKEFQLKIIVSQTDLEDLEANTCAEKNVFGEAAVEIGRDFLIGRGMRGDFTLRSPSGESFGLLTVFLSLTSWGDKIVTRFQSASQNGDFMFKGMEIDKNIKEAESTVNSMLEEEELPETSYREVEPILSSERKRKLHTGEKAELTFENQCGEEESDIESLKEIDSIDSEEQAEDENSQLETKNYKEIEVSINNHLLRIKVMRDKDGRIVYDSGDGQSEEEKRHSIASADEVATKTSNPEPDQEPGVVQIKGDRILLDVPESASEPGYESPIYRFKAGKQMDANVITFSQTADSQMEFGKADLQQETFLMVIKNNRHDTKVKNSNRLDLELRTRKQAEPKPQVVEKDTQYDVPGSGGGKSKKGKNKGDKKKKNKKKSIKTRFRETLPSQGKEARNTGQYIQGNNNEYILEKSLKPYGEKYTLFDFIPMKL